MAGKDAFGSELRVGDGGSPTEVFTTIASVTSISGPSRTKEEIEVTAHDSPDQYREFVPGLKDGGEVTLEINYDPTETTHDTLDTDFEITTLRNFQLVIFPGVTGEEHIWDFAGIITALGDEFPHDDKMERSVTIKISGKPTLTAT